MKKKKNRKENLFDSGIKHYFWDEDNFNEITTHSGIKIIEQRTRITKDVDEFRESLEVLEQDMKEEEDWKKKMEFLRDASKFLSKSSKLSDEEKDKNLIHLARSEDEIRKVSLRIEKLKKVRDKIIQCIREKEENEKEEGKEK